MNFISCSATLSTTLLLSYQPLSVGLKVKECDGFISAGSLKLIFLKGQTDGCHIMTISSTGCEYLLYIKVTAHSLSLLS